MECHDARILLSLARPGNGQLDAVEQEALEQHLEKCPVCASLAQGDRAVDDVLGRAMRDVAMPAGLKERLLQRVATQRPRWRWKPPVAACAAAILIAVTAGLAWHFVQKPEARFAEAVAVLTDGQGWTEEQVEQYFQDQGLSVKVPRTIDYQFLRHVDVVEFKGRRVAKLSFSRNDPAASADVLILPRSQFRLHELPAIDIPGTPTIKVVREHAFAYVIAYHGAYQELTHRADN